MATTLHLQEKRDFYRSKQECIDSLKVMNKLNPRYSSFTQDIFHAGDEQQFEEYRDYSIYDLCIRDINLSSNIFSSMPSVEIWEKYKNLDATAVSNTFQYIFNKFKKGIFVKILDGKLNVFLPFSNINFTNEWGDKIKVNPSKYNSIIDFLKYISIMEGYGHKFNPSKINKNTYKWYANNCLLRYENPLSENDSNVGTIKNMLTELCNSREIPDIEFFINRRDFPLITKNNTEPYNNIWGTNHPLISHNYEKYAPILSMSSSDRYADIRMPTWEDWARISSFENKWFPDSYKENENYTQNFNIPWENKKPTAVFRGSTTGCGTTIQTNQRLKVAYLSKNTNPDSNGIPYLDAGITKWNLRPRKLENQEYLTTIDISSLDFSLVEKLTPYEQSSYKYIVHIAGHVEAFRLSLELNMGSVILLVKSPWKLWYSDLLKEYVHYVPVKEDLSDLISKIAWCRNHDDECKKIAENAKEFYKTYLGKNAILDYMQKILIDLKKAMGVYIYNISTPKDIVISEEYKSLDNWYPENDKELSINEFPIIKPLTLYSDMKGIEWLIKRIISEKKFKLYFKRKNTELFTNKLGIIYEYLINNFSVIVKETSNKEKIKEHIHEAFIGTKCTNELLKIIPNFSYIFGLNTHMKENSIARIDLIKENVIGKTFDEYILSQEFNFQEYLSIILQLCFALKIAQDKFSFVHYDLTPWNIILKRTSTQMTFDYVISHKKIIRVKTSVIPVIIDYGKSYVNYECKHHGFVDMFRKSSVQDILTLLVTSLDKILTRRLSQNDIVSTLKIANFFGKSKYYNGTFSDLNTLKEFVHEMKKYTQILHIKDYGMENLTPIDLARYIKSNFPESSDNNYFSALVSKEEYKNTLLCGSERQVYDFLIAETYEEQLESYKNVFIRIKKSTLPQPKNIFYIYYVMQTFESVLSRVNQEMVNFIVSKNKNISQKELDIYQINYRNTINFLHKLYNDILSSKTLEKINFNMDFKIPKIPDYTDKIFLIPSDVLGVIKKINGDTHITYRDINCSNYPEYSEILTMVFINSEVYKLPDNYKNFYLENFKDFLDNNWTDIKDDIANIKTLLFLSEKIYSENLNQLININISNTENCASINNYIKIYKEILSKEY